MNLFWRSDVTYLVGLVIVLWVVHGNLGLLSVDKVLDELIDTERLSPLLALDKPAQAC
jgi:hypothetical protein